MKNVTTTKTEKTEDIKETRFVMIKDYYCVTGLGLNPSLACFFAFLKYLSDGYSLAGGKEKPFIGYSDSSLAEVYSRQWFPVKLRTVGQYLKELKDANLIYIENEGKPNRKIFINYEKSDPEIAGSVKMDYEDKMSKLTKEYEDKIAILESQIKTLLQQIQVNTKKTVIGEYTQMLFDKKYLTKKDNLTQEQLDEYEKAISFFKIPYQNAGIPLDKSIRYICSQTKSKTIKNKLGYLYTSLLQYLQTVENSHKELYTQDDTKI